MAPVDQDCLRVGLVTELLGRLEKHTRAIEPRETAIYGKRRQRPKLPLPSTGAVRDTMPSDFD